MVKAQAVLHHQVNRRPFGLGLLDDFVELMAHKAVHHQHADVMHHARAVELFGLGLHAQPAQNPADGGRAQAVAPILQLVKSRRLAAALEHVLKRHAQHHAADAGHAQKADGLADGLHLRKAVVGAVGHPQNLGRDAGVLVQDVLQHLWAGLRVVGNAQHRAHRLRHHRQILAPLQAYAQAHKVHIRLPSSPYRRIPFRPSVFASFRLPPGRCNVRGS